MNCFSWYNLEYYLRHPWMWFKDFWHNLRMAHQRVKRGWSNRDVYNMEEWMATILPPMLRKLAEDDAYPGVEPFDTYEKWQNWLREQADKLTSLREDFMENEYQDEFDKVCNAIKKETRNGDTYCVLSYDFDSNPEAKAIRDKYWARWEEISKEKDKLAVEVFTELGKHFFCLWS